MIVVIFDFNACSATASTVFGVSALAALLRALKFLFSPLQNGGVCWKGRGGACVPARTSAQRRFHPKMRYCHPQTLHFHPRMMHFHVQTRCFYPRKVPPNDGCALAGARWPAHRHGHYPCCNVIAHSSFPHFNCRLPGGH